VLVELDMRQEKAQLAAALAQLDLTQLNLNRARGLAAEGVVSQQDYDRASAEYKTAEARVGEIRAAIERKTIRAPFGGMLGIRQVNLGQYLAGGDPVVPLQSLDPIFVNFTVPQQEVGRLRVGGEVSAAVEGTKAPFVGRITAVNSVVDEATRNVQVQATFANPQGRLRPGMFVETKLLMGGSREVVTLPATAIAYAPYGDSVFIVEQIQGPKGEKYKGARQQVVKLGGAVGDQVAVLSGVQAGAEVVSSGVFKLRNGAAIHVDNAVLPGNDQTPKTEDN
jgi:membrane fusion protein (multidrug efflux system)